MKPQPIFFNGEKWPYTGRTAPANAKLEAIVWPPQSKWRSLVWYDDRRDVWIYLSSLPGKPIA